MNYQDLTYKQMLLQIDEDFYKKIATKEEFFEFSKTLVAKFCNQHNIKNIEIKTNELTDFAMYYDPKSEEIFINRFYLDKYEIFAKENSQYFLQNFFNNLVHELRHYLQYTSPDITPLLKSYATLNYFDVSRKYFENIPYSARPHEVDARYFAYKNLRKLKFFSSYYKMKAFKEEENEANYEGYNIVELLKDENLNKIKFLALPLNTLKKSVKQIAFKNGLQFSKTANLQNDIKLNLAINEDIAPDFFSEEFYSQNNSDALEEELNLQQNIFLDCWEDYQKK